MTSKYVDDFFQDVYEREMQLTDRLVSNDGLLVGTLVFLSGVGIYYLKILPSCSLGVGACLFVALGFLFLLCFLAALFCVVASIFPRDTAYLSSPEPLDKYVRGLDAHYNHNHDQATADQLVEEELKATLRQQYVNASQINRTSNVGKNGWQSRAKYSIAGAVVVLVLNTPFTYLVQRAHSDTQKVEVISLPDTDVAPESEVERNGKPRKPAVEAGGVQTASPKARTAQDRSGQERSNQGGEAEQVERKDRTMGDSQKPAQPEKSEAPKTDPPPKPEAPDITIVQGKAEIGDHVKFQGDKKD